MLNQPGLFDPPPTSLLDGRLALLDLETTGTSPTRDRIIEIGLVLFNQGEPVEEWSTLVNPETGLSPFIEGYTGISTSMVAEAPIFARVARELLQKLRGTTLIAHNARFDYGFLKAEFGRLGYTLQLPMLCTVRLSRKLFPRERKHGLDAIIARHGLECSNRHRALDDARVLGDFLADVRRELQPEDVEKAVRLQLKRPSLPSGLSEGTIETIPEGPGVYRFYDSQDRLLYVGKSVNLKQRVMSHFSGDHRSPKGLRISQQLQRIDWDETAGELGALLLEAEQVKRLNPIHNRQLRRHNNLSSLRIPEVDGGFARPEIVTLRRLEETPLADLYGLYRTRNAAGKALRALMDEHALCAKALGLEKGKGACFGYQLKKCRGACIGEEPPAEHNARLLSALAGEKVRDWPYPGPIGIRERHPARNQEDILLIDRWCHLGTAHDDEGVIDLLDDPPPLDFDLDRYKTLVRFMREKKDVLEIVQL